MDVLYGLHPVEEAIRSRPGGLQQVIVARERRDERLERLVRGARDAGVPISLEPRDQLTRLAKTDAHQGVLAMVRARALLTLEDLLAPETRTTGDAAGGSGHRLLLALDGVEDPHNLGALLRTVDAVGSGGVILPERRSAPLSAVVAKSSAGASEHVRIARVTNLVRSLEQAKRANFWIIGLDERGSPDYADFDFCTDFILVLGREGAGLHDLTKRTCDHLLRIPMAGSVASLNVSVAGAVVMFEAVRQRRAVHTATAKAPPLPVPRRQKGLGV